MNTTGLFGILASVIGLSAFSVAIVNGDKTANVLGKGANGFAAIIRAATLQKG